MKHAITLLAAIFISVISFSQTNKEFIDKMWYTDTIYRKVNYDKNTYLIRYRNVAAYSLPLVGRSKFDSATNKFVEDFQAYQDMRHFFSRIDVFRLANRGSSIIDTVLIKRDIHGTYVKSGCFEDVPADWVKKAIEN
jgi:hypothetical protein